MNNCAKRSVLRKTRWMGFIKESFKRISTTFFFFFIFVSLAGCQKSTPENPNPSTGETRIISFSGYKWKVKTSKEGKVGPGPNYFSNSEKNVWVDDKGNLHLRITQRNGKWYCSEVTLLNASGYGHYVFQTDSKMDKLDKKAVVGLFLYSDDTTEIDIEFSRWGMSQNDNSQYVVQPGAKSGNKERFNLSFQGYQNLTNVINWQKDSIEFSNYKGFISDFDSNHNWLKHWIYKGKDNPSEKRDLVVKINFWLFKGETPSKDMEIVIPSFKYL